MTACGQKALTTLLQRAEGAWARQSGRMATLAFNAGSFPDYDQLGSWAETDATNAYLRNAERAGAISIEWDRAARDQQIVRLRLLDQSRLAEFLGATPLWAACESAARALRLGPDSPPSIRALHAAWCAGKAPRKLGPDRVQDFVDALKVIDARRNETSDAPLRRVSARLFHDSKRIEAITPALDVLLANEVSALPRSNEEVWAILGLLKHPQPLLCAGTATLQLTDGSSFRLPKPYAGVAPAALVSVCFEPDTRYLLSVENLTTFNELADARAANVDCLILYTAGMPSPNFVRAYQKMLSALPTSAALLHWGDIDLGGYRIAAALNNAASAVQRSLKLFRMNPAQIEAVEEHRPLGKDELRDMRRIAEQNGWLAEAAGIQRAPTAYEQEALAPHMPGNEIGRTTP